jgi:hypothetical protein
VAASSLLEKEEMRTADGEITPESSQLLACPRIAVDDVILMGLSSRMNRFVEIKVIGSERVTKDPLELQSLRNNEAHR